MHCNLYTIKKHSIESDINHFHKNLIQIKLTHTQMKYKLLVLYYSNSKKHDIKGNFKLNYFYNINFFSFNEAINMLSHNSVYISSNIQMHTNSEKKQTLIKFLIDCNFYYLLYTPFQCMK